MGVVLDKLPGLLEKVPGYKEYERAIRSQHPYLAKLGDWAGGAAGFKVAPLRGIASLPKFLKGTATELEKEKERLTKLFRLYEETEAENKDLKSEVVKWQDWFAANEDLFTRLTSSMEDLRQKKPTTTVDMSAELTELETPNFTDATTPTGPDTKHKRKLRFRK